MRIGIISNLYPPHARGGAEVVAGRIAEAFMRRGHAVSVLTSRPPVGHHRGLALQEGGDVRVYTFAPWNVCGVESLHRASFLTRLCWHVIDLVSPGADRELRAWIEQERPDVIISHNLKGVGVSLGRWTQRFGLRHLHVLHDVQLSVPSGLLLWGEEKTFLNRSFLRRWYEVVAKWAIGKPNVVISPSAFLLNFYRDRGFFPSSMTRVLPNPGPASAVIPRAESVSGPVRLLFVGQLESQKGLLFLIETLLSSSISFQLEVVGEGSLRLDVETLAQKDTRFIYHGRLSAKDVANQMARADAVVVPSLCYENSPTVIYESLVMGVPVLASRLGGIPELVQEGTNGLLFEPGNKTALLAALESFVQKRDDWRAKTSEICATAKRYEMKTIMDEWERILEAL